MDPDDLVLEDLSKNFEYFKVSTEVDNINDIDQLKKICKCYFKLYLKQQEVISQIMLNNS